MNASIDKILVNGLKFTSATGTACGLRTATFAVVSQMTRGNDTAALYREEARHGNY